MKKTILSISLFILAAGSALFISSCSKDSTAPVISVDPAIVTSSLNATYVDDLSGVTANDDQDGNVTANITSTNDINKDLAGVYTVTYSVTDKAGNTGTNTRTVNVVNDAAYLNGTYVCSEDAFATNWTQTITADDTHNNRIIFQYFGDYVTHPLSPQIYAQVSGSSIEISSQTAVGGNNGCTHSLTPNGTGIPIALVTGKYNFSIKFFDQEQNTGGACSGTSPIATEDVCHQQ